MYRNQIFNCFVLGLFTICWGTAECCLGDDWWNSWDGIRRQYDPTHGHWPTLERRGTRHEFRDTIEYARTSAFGIRRIES